MPTFAWKEISLPRPEHVRLKVYDVLGQEISTIVDEYQEPGEHRAVFDGSHFASGVYFYRLQAGGFVQTMKLLLVR